MNLALVTGIVFGIRKMPCMNEETLKNDKSLFLTIKAKSKYDGVAIKWDGTAKQLNYIIQAY
jgi:hypothetical protein